MLFKPVKCFVADLADIQFGKFSELDSKVKSKEKFPRIL